MFAGDRMYMRWILAFSIAFLVHIQCCRNMCDKNGWEHELLNRRTLTRYDVQTEHVRLLQFYLSDKVELSKKPQSVYNYQDHNLEFGNIHSGKIILEKRLAGKYAYSSEITIRRFLRTERRMYLVIYFEEPPMSLKFIEDNDGKFSLLKQDDIVMFEGEKYACDDNKEVYLEIKTRPLPDVRHEDRYIKGAPYVDETPGSLGPFLIALGSLFLLAFLLQQ